jgi:hypothetical protein
MKKGFNFKQSLDSFYVKLGLKDRYGIWNQKRKRLYIIGISVLIVVALLGTTYFITTSVGDGALTGYAVGRDGETAKLEDTGESGSGDGFLDRLTGSDKLDELEGEIVKMREQLNQEVGELDGFKADLVSHTTELTKTIDELRKINEDKEEKLKDENNELRVVVESAVRSLCCSVSDIKGNNDVNWEINHGVIECSGSNDFNCGSGESSFFDSSSDEDENDDEDDE